MAAEFRREVPDAAIALVPSSGGVFEVSVDGVTLFSKKATGRHALPGEVLGLLRQRPR
ncbi:MAG: Rdx family protein [Gemmatimonadetes bacterium]|nr:Rdx family protein [Gemmatimonadota bacterium]MBK7717256.1 Rdx family protein [Gemmatimonadota bacterium]MBK7784882.1 Rdx family protein [Gemmatimonadota bacterium]MBK9066554.1 Rdx family protein [Gemmatimonadota bacterium]MBP9200017.1 Rdx family protein [Gemmatimonadales bacterium]